MMPIIGHESTNFFGGLMTYAEGCRLSPTTYMVMTCNDVGIPLSMQPGKKFKPIPTLFAPTSFSIPIPSGVPVFVGGPYVPDWGAMLRNMAMGFGLGCLMKGVGKGLKKIGQSMNKKASDLMSGIAPKTKTPAKPQLKHGDKYPEWKKGSNYSDIQNPKNPKTAGPNKPFTKKQKDQIYAKNRAAHDGYLVSDMDGTILEVPKKSQKGVKPSQYEAQVDHVKPKSKGGENTGENAQVLSREQNRAKWDSS
ncbi:MAG: HNH endonuclease [Holosporaceae bacterium]|nr:HNH endonuclease [Holosporaceae bacterium]